ncbi:MAG: hypothetical protein WC205_19090 [Opitutaceae bacterium]|jgi:hypothetical protein
MNPPDPLDPLLAALRNAPAPDADRIALGLETRVLARLREERALAATWLRRWSLVLGVGTAACAALLVNNLLDLSAAGLDAACTGHWLLLGWF